MQGYEHCSKEYQAASAKNIEAIRAYVVVRDAYRAGKIGDAEFLEARKAYDLAMAEFDKAFESEDRREEAAEKSARKARKPARRRT